MTLDDAVMTARSKPATDVLAKSSDVITFRIGTNAVRQTDRLVGQEEIESWLYAHSRSPGEEGERPKLRVIEGKAGGDAS